MSEQFSCRNTNAEVIEVPAGLTRRAALTAFAAAFATVGLTSISDSAYAAAKTYNACKTTDIKVGGARMFSIGGKAVVITQPKKGVFRAFYGNCTHQGALLANSVGPMTTQANSLVCPQHGAKFDTTSGKPTAGPASRALLKIKLTVAKNQIKVTL
jgi:nitrite reductase/ring-hydroxylating ferredoxin subunit